MEKFGLALTGPLCLIIFLCGLAMLLGTDPYAVAKGVAVCVPVVGYVVFAIFTVIWAIKTGEIGVRQETSFQAKLYFWHGVAVVLTIILSAAGSFIMLFALLMGRVLGGAV
jgi:hypothetical protein